MDYSEDFRLIQTAMSHSNEFVKKFNEIIYFGGEKIKSSAMQFSFSIVFLYLGSEVYIREVAFRLRNIFASKSYTSDDCDELRKITWLLMLNTDVSLSRDLSEDFHICHLLNNFPQLSCCLFVNLMWQLKLEKYFYESIKFAPSWFILQFIPETIDSLHFSKPLNAIAQVRHLIESIYFNICRMDYKIANTSQQIEQKIMLDKNKLLELIMSLLRNYNTPNADDDIAKSKKKLKEYLGYSLNHQLTLIHNCFKMFHNKPQFAINEDMKIFKLMAEKEPEVNNFSTKTYSPVIEETLTKINIVLLNTLQNSVLNITLDDFMYWVEIDTEDPLTEDPDLKRDNLQKSVGEMSYALTQLINDNECFQHNVASQLQTISIKPKTLAEIASEATVGTVLDKIETSPNKRIWFEELLNRPDTLYFNTECFQTIVENIEVVNLKDLLKILKDHQNYGDMDREDELQFKEFLHLAGQRLNNLEVRDFIEELIRVFGVDYNFFNDDVGDGAFASEITNYFNKLTGSDLHLDQLWKLILMNPSKFYESLVEKIDQQDKSQIEIVLRILSETNSIAGDFIKEIVQNNLEASAESSKSNYHHFLAGLFKLNLIDRREFIRDVLMNNLTQAMSVDNLKTIAMLLNTLKQFSAKLKIDDLMSPLAILLAQILNKFRWDLMSFNQQKEAIVEGSIEVIQDLVKTILINGKQSDKDFVLNNIKECKPMTRFYFQKFTFEKGASIATFDKFLHPEDFDSTSKNKIAAFLCENIVRCTTKELKWLMTNEKLQPFITDALFIIALIVNKSNQQGAINCLHKCVSDYVKILKVS